MRVKKFSYSLLGPSLTLLLLTLPLLEGSLNPFSLSQSSPSGENLLPREKLIADVRQLASILESAHPDPYLNGGGKIAFHRRLQELLLDIPQEGMTPKDFYRLLLPFVAAIGDGHTGLLPLTPENPPCPGIPLKFGIVEKSLYVAGVYEPGHKPLIGARIVSIEGIPLEELIQQQARLRGWDNEYQLLSIFVRNLETRFGLEEVLPEWSGGPAIRMALQHPSGELNEYVFSLPEKLQGPPITAPTAISLPSVENTDFGYSFLDQKRRVALLRIDGMFRFRENFEFFAAMKAPWVMPQAVQLYQKIYGKPAPSDLSKVIASLPAATDAFRSLVQEMHEARSQALVVDLRRNGGGNSLLSTILAYFLFDREQLLKSFARGTTIRKYSDLYFSLYQGDTLEKINEGKPFPLLKDDYDFSEDPSFRGKTSEDPAAKAERYLQMTPTFQAEYRAGKYAAFYRPPQIIVITSPVTYSAGYNLASTLYKLGAMVVGVPSGQAGNCFGDTLFFRLANSGISGTVSYKRFLEYPDDPEKGRMLRPHYELTYKKLASYGFDPNAEIRLALEIIGSNGQLP